MSPVPAVAIGAALAAVAAVPADGAEFLEDVPACLDLFPLDLWPCCPPVPEAEVLLCGGNGWCSSKCSWPGTRGGGMVLEARLDN